MPPLRIFFASLYGSESWNSELPTNQRVQNQAKGRRRQKILMNKRFTNSCTHLLNFSLELRTICSCGREDLGSRTRRARVFTGVAHSGE
jgi:hypothetical protein